MASVKTSYKIVNPGKRKASPAQLAARAKFAAMVRAKHGNPRKRLSKGAKVSKASQGNRRIRKATAKKDYVRSYFYNKQHAEREGNPGEILTIGLNPGSLSYKLNRKRLAKKKGRVINTMAKRRRKAVRRANPVSRRRRVVRRKRHTTRNPGIMRAVHRRIKRYRRHNPVVRHKHIRRYGRRSNPSFSGLKTTGMTVLGLIGGAIVTKKLTDALVSFVPSLGTGFLKYVTTGVMASIIGFGVGKFAKSPGLGSAMALGGYTLVGLQIAQDYFPGFASLSPFGLRGMGLIGPSSFYVPQVPVNGAFSNVYGNFVTPASVMSAMPVAKGMKGLGATVYQPGRTRLSRVA